MKDKIKPTVVLCIMDGWGINKKSEHNAVALANTPNVDYLTNTYPYSTLEASGEHVGLPTGQVGNSEVGHMNLGSGRVVVQTLPKINNAFENDEIRHNKNFIKFISQHKKEKTIHLLGLCSDGGVHSHTDHIIEISKLLDEYNINSVLHVFSDGRDSSPKQFGDIIKKFEASLPKNIKIGTLIGRYFAMDRDNRWDRIKKSFDLIKIDCQGAEIPILKGGKNTVLNTPVIILEIPFMGEYNVGVPNFFEHIKYMNKIGYQVYDIIEMHRVEGILIQIDIIFIKKGHAFEKNVHNIIKNLGK